MMLQALIRYAERENLGDACFETVGVRWLIPVDSEAVPEPIPLGDNPEGRRPKPKPLRRPFTSPNELNQGDKSHFLCDILERAVLFVNEKSPEARRVQHRYFKGLLAEAADACPDDAAKLRAVLRFLDNLAALRKLHERLAEAKAKVTDIATFSVDGVSLLDLEEVKAFWRNRRAAAGNARQRRICLATGEMTETLDTHEKIKGIPGGLPGGANLISFDKESFCSYGLAQAQNAALSAPAELKVRSALTALVERSREQKLVFNDAIYLHWTRQPIQEDPVDLLASPDENAIAELLKSFRSGQPPLQLNANNYYAASLSGNGTRIVVRDWIESTVPEVKLRVAQWFQELGIVVPDGTGVKREFGLGQLLWALANPKLEHPFDALAHGAGEGLLRAALTGGAVPQNILTAALRRETVDRISGGDDAGQRRPFLPSRFALMKLCLLRSPNRKENCTMSEKLDPDSKDVAYLCGQLFAVLGRLQLLALGRVGASVVERTYGGVATRPASTLGPLFTKVPAYLKKANDRFPGSGTNKQKEIENLCLRIEAEGGLKQTLGLEEQARFALGYYCRLAEYRARREEAELEKQAEQVEAAD
jgi:CRISPR-associated protein Csd1